MKSPIATYYPTLDQLADAEAQAAPGLGPICGDSGIVTIEDCTHPDGERDFKCGECQGRRAGL